jgi:glutathione S-transferase
MERTRLTYFDMRGRAESIRLLLHATQTAFEDTRIVSRDEWAALKPTLPFGALPIYESQGIRLGESHAILRHLGRRLTSATQTELTVAELDVAQEAIAESQEDLWRFNWGKDYYDRLESYAQETLRPRLQRLERWLTRDRSGSREWFGAAFSHVDCLAFCYLDEVDAFFPVVLADFAELAELRLRVGSLSGISAYLQSASRPIVFGMGRMGPKVDPRVSIPSDFIFSNPWSDPIDLTEVVRSQRRLTRGCSGPRPRAR